MTREEVMALSDEELRIKAAELIGWTAIDREDMDGWTSDLTNKPIPDYPNDIAAGNKKTDGKRK